MKYDFLNLKQDVRHPKYVCFTTLFKHKEFSLRSPCTSYLILPHSDLLLSNPVITLSGPLCIVVVHRLTRITDDRIFVPMISE